MYDSSSSGKTSVIQTIVAAPGRMTHSVCFPGIEEQPMADVRDDLRSLLVVFDEDALQEQHQHCGWRMFNAPAARTFRPAADRLDADECAIVQRAIYQSHVGLSRIPAEGSGTERLNPSASNATRPSRQRRLSPVPLSGKFRALMITARTPPRLRCCRVRQDPCGSPSPLRLPG